MASQGLSDEGCSGTDAWPDSGAWPVIKDGRAVAYTFSGTYPGPEIMVDWLINFGWSDWRLIIAKKNAYVSKRLEYNFEKLPIH